MNRVQTLRSSITGWRPIAGTRQPGELYVNWADLALGTINTTLNPVDLVAVRYWSVAANYAVGDHVIYSGLLYRAIAPVTAGAFNPVQWSSVSSFVLPIASTTVLGGVKIDGSTITITGEGVISASPSGYVLPTASTTVLGGVKIDGSTITIASGVISASPSGYTLPTASTTVLGGVKVDGSSITIDGGGVIHGAGGAAFGANLLDNGDMSVQQRSASTLAVTSGGHILLDRWAAYATASRYTIGQTYNGLPPPPGFATFLGAQCTSATATGLTDYFALQQGIEGATLNGLKWGVAGAQTLALSFWACSSVTGLFSGALNNGANNRTYAFTFSLPVASTPTFISMTIPGDTAGTWVNVGPSAQLFLIFDLGSGTSNRTTAGSWGAGDFVGATGAAGIMGNNGATFYVTGVKLEVGSATPYVYDPPQVRLARCQRYFLSLDQAVVPIGTKSPDLSYGMVPFMVNMRAVPSWTFGTITYVGCSGLAVDTVTTTSAVLRATATAASGGKATSIPMTFAAEI
jgi:hypothetical protein